MTDNAPRSSVSSAGGPPARAADSRDSRDQARPLAETGFPVVAIGASAGGLDAFRGLLAKLPADTGMSFILVQHLDPSHASRMIELLSPLIEMPILEARDGVQLAPDHVYVIPPGGYIAVRHGAIRLTPPQTGQAVRMPFDFLLQSLADCFGERAICVILSGTGSDGSEGASAISTKGGLVIAQEPTEAEQGGMPRSAIASNAVDMILPLAGIAKALVEYARHGRPATTRRATPLSDENIGKILELLRKSTSHDFAQYKHGTVGRRIERRMGLAGVHEGDRYLALLNTDPAELQRLADDLLINVTRFFRDDGPFELLQKMVPDLVRAQPPERPIRAWVPGCSTGEEAYSIAMLVLEGIAEAGRHSKLQIFASDLDQEAIAVAREGFYARSIEADMSPQRLARFFREEGAGYRVCQELRAAVVFSVHDLLSDPPFFHLDLVSCRNLLIYLRPEVQQRVISSFNFSLREGGLLLLGSSESVGGAGDSFELIGKNERIYRHVSPGRAGLAEFSRGRGGAVPPLWSRLTRRAAPACTDEAELTQRLLLEAYAPASVLVTAKHEALYFFGPTDRYLTIPPGPASRDLLASARAGLRPAIRAALETAARGDDQPVAIRGRVIRDRRSIGVTVTARPVKSGNGNLILISFVEAPEQESKERVVELPAEAGRVSQLEQELDATRIELENSIRERETAEEELRAVNEEAMSASEEFQTTNEELETSKEELQSLNEELTALNSQLQEMLDRYQAVANDLENILRSTDLATLFLDEKLNIRYFTPAAKSLFRVIASDVGRPLADLAQHFVDGTLLADAATVLANDVPIMRDVMADNGAWYTCRIFPYRSKDNRIEGVVVTFVDVTVRKLAEDAVKDAQLLAESANLAKSRFLAAASHDLRQPLQTLNLLHGLLARKLDDPDALRLVTLSDEALAVMSGMLNTLLDINQLEAGVIRAEPVVFEIDTLLERLKTEFAYHTQAHGLEWHVLSCRLAVFSDIRLLEQMIRNLLANAVKYTSKGGILLGCRRRGDKLRIEIWDTGLGIPATELRLIFEEFHQIDNPARELSRGLGLGLAIVKRLGDLLGHAVDVRSRVGRGSVFSIEIPLVPEGMPIAPRPAPVERPPGAIQGEILIIEDDPDLRSSLDLLLRGEGHIIAAAADGDEAIALVARKESTPHLAIADYNLPGGLSGVEVVARLRATMGNDLPALILTGDISTLTLREIAAQGHVPLHKPVPVQELSRHIQDLLARVTAPSRAPALAPPEGAGEAAVAIAIIDDDPSIRGLMRDFLAGRGWAVKTFADSEAFLRTYRPGGTACLILDAQLPGIDGLELLRLMRAQGNAPPSIMVTGHADVRMAVEAMKEGAVDFVEKPVNRDELLASIVRVFDRPQDASRVGLIHAAAASRLAELSPREREVLERVLAGQPSKNIAADLGVSQRTVENHRAAVMKKSGAKSLPDLVRLALAAREP